MILEACAPCRRGWLREAPPHPPTPSGARSKPFFSSQECGAEGTLGSYLAAEMHCDKQDPHRFLTGSSFPRSVLLENAIRIAFTTLAARRERAI